MEFFIIIICCFLLLAAGYWLLWAAAIAALLVLPIVGFFALNDGSYWTAVICFVIPTLIFALIDYTPKPDTATDQFSAWERESSK